MGQLGIPLGTANSGLRALGLAPLRNGAGHQHQFQVHVARERATIHDHLRDRFRDTHARRKSLDDYLRLRELSGLVPDSRWLDQHWDLTEELMAEQVRHWLDTQIQDYTPTIDTALPGVETSRQRGRRTVNEAVTAAHPLVDAWLHRNAAGTGPRPRDNASVIAAITAAGLIDFGQLRRGDVFRWLLDSGQWPLVMPLVTKLTELGLTDGDIVEAKLRLEAGRDQSRRQATYITFGAHPFSAEPEDLIALADAVRDQIPADLLDTPPTLVLREFASTSLGGGNGGGGGDGGGAWRASNESPEKTNAMGLAGEIIAGEWIERHYGLPTEVTWVSGYRHDVLADGKGNDRLGYDFEVATEHGKVLYEVKATVDDIPQFALGESEVRRASDLADDEQYVILLVTHVLDPERQRIHPLPNPMAGGMRYFHLAGRSLRLQFELVPRGTSS